MYYQNPIPGFGKRTASLARQALLYVIPTVRSRRRGRARNLQFTRSDDPKREGHGFSRAEQGLK